MNEIISLPSARREDAVRTLTSAFTQDVMWKGLLPDDDERDRIMPAVWRGVIAYCQRYGIVTTTPDVQGIAAWTKPGHSSPTLWKLLRTGFLLPRAIMQMSKVSRERFLREMKRIDQIHSQVICQPHWYLWGLGVGPEHQGTGIGGDLLTSMFEQAQKTGLPCYLETETESNVAFYTKRGFEVADEAEFTESGFQLWFMVRTS
jgi:ribosomal protein S18 acetylase RimI-like enzyme